MTALDTNLLARLLLQDGTAQHARVKALLATNQVFTAPMTVLLQLVWVLEANDCSATDIASGLTLLLGLPNFKPEQAGAVRAAIHGYAQGMDFAGTLHLALSGDSDAFMTLDKAFVRKAGKLGARPRVVNA